MWSRRRFLCQDAAFPVDFPLKELCELTCRVRISLGEIQEDARRGTGQKDVINWLLSCFASHVSECSGRRTSCSCVSCVSLHLPGRVGQARGSVSQIGRADSGSALRVGLPCCSEHGVGDGARQLGAGDPLCVREGRTLSDKEL